MSKKIISFMVFSIIIFFSAAAVYSDDLSGIYYLNTNNNIGYLDITVSGNKVSGEMVWTIDRNGNPIDLRADIKNGSIKYSGATTYIYFERVGNPQKYHGYFSYDKTLISGFFEKGYKIPWYAIKE